MDEKKLSQMIKEVNAYHIPDDVDIWDKVKREIKVKQTPYFKGASRHMLTSVQPRRYGKLSARVAAILIAVLTFGIGVVIAMNTVIQRFIQQDAGLQAIYQQGLGYEIGISQTIDGFTVTLEWAYADSNRLTLAYTIQGYPSVQYTNLLSDVGTLRLQNTDEELSFIQGMNALIDSNGEIIVESLPTSNRSVEIRSYDLSNVLDDQPTLDLNLELEPYGVTLLQRTLMPIEQFDDMKEGPETRFIFDFSVALINELRVMNNSQTTTDQDIRMRLKQVTVSPSQTRVIVCFVPPDPARQWTAIPRLTTDAGEVPGGGGVHPFMDGDESCQDYTYFAGMFDYTGEWRLEITELIGFGSGGGNDQQRIPGSWVFEFIIP